tara:strand:- start:1008 stop:2012 length:1005 start_codon:yes stop_codon:yes gene_type:complete
MILKSFLVEKDLSQVDIYPMSLFYGENIGLKDDIKYEIKKKYNTFEQINFYQEELLKNNKLLDRHINNKSLFNEKKLIFINEVSDKLKNVVISIADNFADNVKIFLFAQNLEKKSTLRSLFERDKKIAIIPCYQDNHRTLSEYVKKKLKDYKGINQEIINLLIDNSGNDRKVLSNEMEKIKSLFSNKIVDGEKTLALLNNTYNLDFNDLRDSCLEGNKEKLNNNLGNVMLQNEDAYFYLNSLNSRVQKLDQLYRQYMNEKNMELALEKLTPKIFWKDKPIFLRQIKKWNLRKLEMAKKNIIDTEIKLKTKLNNYNGIIIKNLLVKLYRIASSTS